MSGAEQDIGARSRKRVVLLALLLVVLSVLVVSIGVGVVQVGLPLYRMAIQVRETRKRLLNQVDYAAIQGAARELCAKYKEDVDFFLDDPRIPEAIRSTNPTYISVYRRSVRIEYGGGFHHQGFLVIPDGDLLPVPTADQNFQKLLDDVWFYEDK